MEISIRDLRNLASEVVRQAQTGEAVTITCWGHPVAQTVPLSATEPTQTKYDPRRYWKGEKPSVRDFWCELAPGSKTTAEIVIEGRQ
jgi:prevent-host-death family protein